MSVQEADRTATATATVTPTVTVPRPAEPADPPLPPPAVAPLLGRDRPLSPDERQFLLGSAGVLVVLSAYIVVFLLLGHYAWS